MAEKEIWKSHPDIVGIEVSTIGNVRTLDRVASSETMTRFTKGRILKQCLNHNGYMQVNIPVDGKWAMKRVHRLVAQTFITNTDNLPEINHKDSDRTNNNVSNLEWCSHSYNIKYREKFGEALGHHVFAVNLTTLEVSRFLSQREAERTLGVSQGNVSDVIKGELEQTDGYWFVNDDDNADDAINRKLHEIKHRSTLKMH